MATVALAQEWAHGAAHDDASGRAPAQTVLGEHGWDRDLPSFRPFLSYAELATMFDTLSSLYEALTPVLGLADIDELAASLGTARLAYDNQRKTVASARDGLIARLDPDDEHAALVAAALKPRKPDLDAIAQLLADAPDYSGDTALLRRLAGLHVPSDEAIGEAFTALRVAERAQRDAAKTDARAGHAGRRRCCARRSRSATRSGSPTTARSAAPPTCSTTPGRRTPRSRRRR